MKPTAQDIQDEIFRKMSADEKLKVGASLWRLGKELAAGKITYDGNGKLRSETFVVRDRRNS